MLRKSSPLASISYLVLHQRGFACEWHGEMPGLSPEVVFFFFCLAFCLHTDALLCGPSLTSLLPHQELALQAEASAAHTLNPARTHVRRA